MDKIVVDKWFAKSRSFWGAVYAVLPGIFTFAASTFGFDPTPIDLPLINEAITGFLNSTNEIAGIIIMAWGRYHAAGSRLVFLPPPKPEPT